MIARQRVRIGVPALWALRAYWGTSVLLVCAAAMALAAILPVTSLLHSGTSAGARLGYSTVGAAIAAQGWGGASRTPAVTQMAAIRGLFQILLGVMGAVAAMAGLTLGSLFGARASDRATEVAARRAVGASRRVLAGSALVEGCMLALVAVAFGAVAGMLVAQAAMSGWPGSVSAGTIVPSIVAGCAIGGLVIVCAMLPIVFARERRVADTSGRPLELALPALQLGLSLVVLTAGGLLAQHAAATVALSGRAGAGGEVFRQIADDSTPADRASRYAVLLEALTAGGRFDTVSLTATGGIVGLGTVSVVTTDCGQCSEGGIFLPWHVVSATHQFVSADTFHALGVRVLSGRGITGADRWGAEPVAVVSRSLAVRHFQRGEAIGRKILLGDDPRTWHTVVGIVDDPVVRGLGGNLQPHFTVYASVLQHPVAAVDLLVRGRAGMAADATAAAAVRRAFASGTRRPVRMKESDMLAAEVMPLRWFARWIGYEGWIMLALACGGTFALMRLWVLSLLTELGLRRAVGARRRHLLGFVLLRAAGAGLMGVGVGVWFGPAVWSALGSVVPGFPVWSTATVARFALILLAAAVAGALPPAVRAARTPPAALLAWT